MQKSRTVCNCIWNNVKISSLAIMFCQIYILYSLNTQEQGFVGGEKERGMKSRCGGWQRGWKEVVEVEGEGERKGPRWTRKTKTRSASRWSRPSLVCHSSSSIPTLFPLMAAEEQRHFCHLSRFSRTTGVWCIWRFHPKGLKSHKKREQDVSLD